MDSFPLSKISSGNRIASSSDENYETLISPEVDRGVLIAIEFLENLKLKLIDTLEKVFANLQKIRGAGKKIGKKKRENLAKMIKFLRDEVFKQTIGVKRWANEAELWLFISQSNVSMLR